MMNHYFHNLGHDGQEQRVLKKLTLTSSSKEPLIKLVDKAREVIREKHEENKKSSNETIRIYYFQKEFWNMLSKAPKRPIETLYLKEGEKETLLSMVEGFMTLKHVNYIYHLVCHTNTLSCCMVSLVQVKHPQYPL